MAALAVAVVLTSASLAACGSHAAKLSVPASSSTTSTSSTTVAPSTTTARVAATCPLTDEPPAGGTVPQRPALAVKMDNLDAARPQYGLSSADVVYEEPVEGGITRFIVIYQCNNAARVEPIRSGRIIDPEILEQFGAHTLLAYAGGIGPAVAAIDSSSLIDIGVDRAPVTTYWRDPSRYGPHNLTSSTATLYAVGWSEHAPKQAPPSVFTFGALPAGAAPAASLHIAYLDSNLTWAWQPGLGAWVRSYADTGPAAMAEGGQINAANVVVMRVVMYPSPYVEDATGSHENLLVLTGSGPVQVYRNGAVVSGTWVRPNLAQTTEFLDANHNVIPLSPGRTWVELVPTTVTVTATP
jgi:Protein of unknown function (DUF3048) N-terminal domain/Protein of unknown function (DUF3048) C-terminal domain